MVELKACFFLNNAVRGMAGARLMCCDTASSITLTVLLRMLEGMFVPLSLLSHTPTVRDAKPTPFATMNELKSQHDIMSFIRCLIMSNILMYNIV